MLKQNSYHLVLLLTTIAAATSMSGCEETYRGILQGGGHTCGSEPCKAEDGMKCQPEESEQKCVCDESACNAINKVCISDKCVDCTSGEYCNGQCCDSSKGESCQQNQCMCDETLCSAITGYSCDDETNRCSLINNKLNYEDHCESNDQCKSGRCVDQNESKKCGCSDEDCSDGMSCDDNGVCVKVCPTFHGIKDKLQYYYEYYHVGESMDNDINVDNSYIICNLDDLKNWNENINDKTQIKNLIVYDELELDEETMIQISNHSSNGHTNIARIIGVSLQNNSNNDIPKKAVIKTKNGVDTSKPVTRSRALVRQMTNNSSFEISNLNLDYSVNGISMQNVQTAYTSPLNSWWNGNISVTIRNVSYTGSITAEAKPGMEELDLGILFAKQTANMSFKDIKIENVNITISCGEGEECSQIEKCYIGGLIGWAKADVNINGVDISGVNVTISDKVDCDFGYLIGYSNSDKSIKINNVRINDSNTNTFCDKLIGKSDDEHPLNVEGNICDSCLEICSNSQNE